MNEEEAKTKWCPFTRATANDTEWHSNRPSFADTDKNPFDTCIASACMAWRWDYSPEQVAYHAKEAPQAYADGKFIARGRCGLAGALR